MFSMYSVLMKSCNPCNQETSLTPNISYSPYSGHQSKPDAAKLGPSKASYRCNLHILCLCVFLRVCVFHTEFPWAGSKKKKNLVYRLMFCSRHCRSPLTGILQLQHVKDFCNLLVEVSTEAVKNLSGRFISVRVYDFFDSRIDYFGYGEYCSHLYWRELLV